jgi:DNA-binding NarL/FixJ family response regulator
MVQSAPWRVALYLVVALAMGSFGMILLRSVQERDHRAMKTVLRGIGISCIGFIPLSIIEYVWQNQSVPLSLEYLLYLGVNGSILVALVQVLAKNAHTSEPFKEISDETASRFSLTTRERQMATLIAQGMTNKEIAFELKISEATVRTHIYHLFQKVGAQSRIELLKLLNS